MEGRLELARVPQLHDLDTLREVLEHLGAHIERSGDRLSMESTPEGATEAPYDLVRRMRASICVLGPLLARRGRARVSLPGGCVLGPRPVDIHLRAMESLGATIEVRGGIIEATAPRDRLRGGRLELEGPHGSTVLGSANALVAAACARGESCLEGMAIEPEIVGLGDMLRAAGARIEGLGTRTCFVEGVDSLQAPSVEVPADRMEVGTLLLAGAATRGKVRVIDCQPQEQEEVLRALRDSGVAVERGADWIEVNGEQAFQPSSISTAPFPGFPTDLQAPWMVFALCGPTPSTIQEGIYLERFLHVEELKRMGAKLERRGATVTVQGSSCLEGAPVIASDLRAAAALVMAGLVASGTTTVRRVYHLDRGYECFEKKLSALGANVVRSVDEQAP